jgi:L-asparaginase
MIGLLFTGGTISMKLDPATGAAVPALGADDILAQVRGLEEIAEIEVEDFSRLPGPHVTPEQMWRLARRASAWLERPDIDGLVITHGTDTIEETAFLLDLLLLTDKPVVMVGAMRTVSDVGWDGPANLLAAVRVAAAPAASGQGVLVVMDERILPAREVRKVHTESSASFTAPEFGPLGQVDAGQVLIRRTVRARPSWRSADAEPGLRVSRLDTRVSLLQTFTGMDDGLVKCVAATDTRGLALVAYGRGNVPPSIMPALESAIAGGLLVTVSSRCVAGRVSARYGYEGGGLHLRKAGAVLASDLTGAKARLLQMVALGTAKNTAEAKELVLTMV